MLTVEQERDYIARIRAGDKAAREAFTAHFLGLARDFAHRLSSDLEYEDREAAAFLGLAYAIDHITNPGERGGRVFDGACRFSTYAAYWIKAYIRHAIDAERHHACEIAADSIVVDEERQTSLLDSVAVVDYGDPSERASMSLAISKMLDAVRDDLTAREADILEQRYGLNGRTKQTLDTIGAALGLTKERVRQIEADAIGKLQGVVGLAV